jgi:TPP-dependent trihydroxycyclohexane-1,2-dione (THcHDO) dehydratase
VLQQRRHYEIDPTFGVDDAFKAVRYWDRIHAHPRRSCSRYLPRFRRCWTLPTVGLRLSNTAGCGNWTYDYPQGFFAKRVHHIRRVAGWDEDRGGDLLLKVPHADDYYERRRSDSGAVAELTARCRAV